MVLTAPPYRLLMEGNSIIPRLLFRNLVSYWKLDEASGSRADSFGTNTMTDVNTVTGNPGPSPLMPLASQFTAANSETLSIADNASLSTEGTDWSFNIWIYLDAKGANRGIAGKDDNSAGNREWYLRFVNATDVLNIALQNSTTNIASLTTLTFGAPPATTWLMVMITYSYVARLVTISVNATPRNTATASGDITASAASFYIGRDFGNVWDGREAGAAFWKRVVSTSEEAWLYNDGKGRAFPWR